MELNLKVRVENLPLTAGAQAGTFLQLRQQCCTCYLMNPRALPLSAGHRHLSQDGCPPVRGVGPLHQPSEVFFQRDWGALTMGWDRSCGHTVATAFGIQTGSKVERQLEGRRSLCCCTFAVTPIVTQGRGHDTVTPGLAPTSCPPHCPFVPCPACRWTSVSRERTPPYTWTQLLACGLTLVTGWLVSCKPCVEASPAPDTSECGRTD